MTRRILFMLLAFTAIVLVGAVVPLTLNATSHDRNSFSQAVAGMARTDAAIAQARLDSIAQQGKGGVSTEPTQTYAPLLTILQAARQAGDGLLILASRISIVNGTIGYQQTLVVNNTAMPPGNRELAEESLRGQAVTREPLELLVRSGATRLLV